MASPQELDKAAREIAKGLDENSTQALDRLRADSVLMDPKEFKQFADLINKYEKNHDGTDLVVGKDGRIILTFAPLGEFSRGRTLLPNSREDLNVGEEARRTGKYAGEVNLDSSIIRPERTK